ncbi:MAG: SAM-dependent methyltransferase [Bacteroidetes bacterium]|nr:SAM-dependent methyltransferase [Bacteroidota bacterium]
MKTGTLYLIPAPLGDDSDYQKILPPFIGAVVNTISHYVVENEKTARHYLKKLKIEKPLQELILYPLNKFTPAEDISGYLKPLEDGHNMGIISEAGCPGVADPGAEVVKLAHEKNIKVVPLTGPSSILLALMASGLNGQSFSFHGYLPIEQRDRAKKIKDLEYYSRANNHTQIFIETPYRNEKMLEDLIKNLPDSTLLCIAVDITLPTEYIITLPISKWKKKKIHFHKKPAVFLFL